MKHDYLADRAANFKLMEDIRAWWRRRGCVVKVWLEKTTDPTNNTVIYVIRTNIVQDCANIRSKYVVE
jgi:hypothetical protein